MKTAFGLMAGGGVGHAPLDRTKKRNGILSAGEEPSLGEPLPPGNVHLKLKYIMYEWFDDIPRVNETNLAQ